jgi:hypothetical protein
MIMKNEQKGTITTMSPAKNTFEDEEFDTMAQAQATSKFG